MNWAQQDMAQPLDPLRLKGTMLDTKKAASRNRDKTGKEQRDPGELALSRPKALTGAASSNSGGGDSNGAAATTGNGGPSVGDAMEVE